MDAEATRPVAERNDGGKQSTRKSGGGEQKHGGPTGSSFAGPPAVVLRPKILMNVSPSTVRAGLLLSGGAVSMPVAAEKETEDCLILSIFSQHLEAWTALLSSLIHESFQGLKEWLSESPAGLLLDLMLQKLRVPKPAVAEFIGYIETTENMVMKDMYYSRLKLRKQGTAKKITCGSSDKVGDTFVCTSVPLEGSRIHQIRASKATPDQW